MKPFSTMILTLLLFLLLSACSSAENNLASLDTMPDFVKTAPVSVQKAYQFAAANPDVLKQLPCYCGCGSMGHTSNFDCYVAEQNPDGSVKRFDEHALGCSICVDITLDSMRLLSQGKTIAEIKTYVDSTYSRYGLSNMP
jgi:hypothetical protein